VIIQKTTSMINWSSFFGHFPKYYMEILLGDCNVTVGREYFQTDNWE